MGPIASRQQQVRLLSTENPSASPAGRGHSETRRLLLTGIVCILIAACSPAGGNSEDAGGADSEQGSPSDAATSQSTEEGQAGSDDVLRVAVYTELATFDPSVFAAQNSIVYNTIYDRLARYDEDLNVVPHLAVSWEVIEPGLRLELEIHEDASFHSGEPVTAQAVVDNFERAMDPERGNNLAGVVAPLAGVSTSDEHRVELEFSAPTPERAMLDVLQQMPIIDPQAFDQLGERGSGSGPFIFDSWEPGVRLALSRNEEYWGGPPAVSGVEFLLFGDSDAAAAALEAGEADVVLFPPARDAVRLRDQGFTAVQPVPLPGLFRMFVNTTRPPFDNQQVRQALWHLVNREAIVEVATAGLAEPRVLPWPPASIAYNPDVYETHDYDVERAQELLKEAGFEGAHLEIPTVNEPPFEDIMQIIQADLAQAGITSDIVVMDAPEWFERLTSSDFELILSEHSHTIRYPSNITYVPQMALEGEGTVDYRGSSNDRYVQAVQRVASAISEGEQSEAIEDLNQVLLDEAFAIDVASSPRFLVHSPEVSGVRFSPGDFAPLFTDAQLGR